MQAAVILIVEARPEVQSCRALALSAVGHDVVTARFAGEAMTAVRANAPALVVVGRVEPDGDATALAAALGALVPGLPVLLILGDGARVSATEAHRAGAPDALVEPVADEVLLGEVARILTAGKAFGALSGRSPAMADVYARINAVARSSATVFVTGESGTGKGLCARAIHDQSGRVVGPFIRVDCATLGVTLPEIAADMPPKSGVGEAQTLLATAMARAAGGTLFLDNICDLDPGFQPVLLRALQGRTGGGDPDASPAPSDVRIICATSADPVEAVSQGRFRADLYYRLHVLSVRMPPLRARGADITDIANQELRRLSRQEGRRFTRLSDQAGRVFAMLDWPGNVRQLLNVIHEIVVLHDGAEVTIDMIPPEFAPHPTRGTARDFTASIAPFMGKTLAEIERLVIEATIAQHGGSVSRAARVLDVAPSTLYRKIEAWSAIDDVNG